MPVLDSHPGRRMKRPALAIADWALPGIVYRERRLHKVGESGTIQEHTPRR